MKPGVWIFLGFLGALIGLGFLVSQRFESSPPMVVAPETIVLGPGSNPLVIEIDDPDSGVRSVHARLLDQAGSRNLGEESYPGSLLKGSGHEGRQRTFGIDLDPSKLQVADGNATLVVSVRDWSWRDTFAGNRTELSIPV